MAGAIQLTDNFYVYVYLRLDGSPYYVGKGCNGRWKQRHSVEVPPADRVIFPITNTTEEWALFVEADLIDQWGRLNDGTGILENFSDGGKGSAGYKLSNTQKQKISLSLIGNKRNLGKSRKFPMNIDAKKKISAKLIGNGNSKGAKHLNRDSSWSIKQSISQGKLTIDQVIEIRNLINTKTKIKDIAKRYNVNRHAIGAIKNGNSYKFIV